MEMKQYDLIIIGGGAAGLTAAQYGARSGLKTILIEGAIPGGQALWVESLENYPGLSTPISGFEMAERFTKQAEEFGAEIAHDQVSSVTKEKKSFHVQTESTLYAAEALIVATGAKRRYLGVKGEEELGGKGVSYCATCDGPFFKGKRILVVGGGDAACVEAMFLSKLSDNIVMIHRKETFRAQKAIAQQVLDNESIQVRFNTTLVEIKGISKVESVLLRNGITGEIQEEPMDAVFIFIGSEPQTQLVDHLVQKDEGGYIVTNSEMESSCPGLFAAGDVRATPFRQVIVAASDGAIAARCASIYLDRLRGTEYK